jgi:hypothetical protein
MTDIGDLINQGVELSIILEKLKEHIEVIKGHETSSGNNAELRCCDIKSLDQINQTNVKLKALSIKESNTMEDYDDWNKYANNTQELDLQDLSHFSELKDFAISAKDRVKPLDVSALINLETLWILSNEYFEVIGIEKLQRLKLLNYTHNNSSVDLISLKGLQSLEELSLCADTVTGFESLSTLPKLKCLDLNTVCAIPDLNSLTLLEDLSIFMREPYSFEGISRLYNLERLSIVESFPRNSINIFKHLINLDKLEELHLNLSSKVIDLKPLKNLKNLKQVEIVLQPKQVVINDSLLASQVVLA